MVHSTCAMDGSNLSQFRIVFSKKNPQCCKRSMNFCGGNLKGALRKIKGLTVYSHHTMLEPYVWVKRQMNKEGILFYPLRSSCVTVYVKELNTFLWFFSSSSVPSSSSEIFVHVPLLADGLNSERVCDKRVKNIFAFFLWSYNHEAMAVKSMNSSQGKCKKFMKCAWNYFFTFFLSLKGVKKLFSSICGYIPAKFKSIHDTSLKFRCIGWKEFLDYRHLCWELLLILIPCLWK